MIFVPSDIHRKRRKSSCVCMIYSSAENIFTLSACHKQLILKFDFWAAYHMPEPDLEIHLYRDIYFSEMKMEILMCALHDLQSLLFYQLMRLKITRVSAVHSVTDW